MRPLREARLQAHHDVVEHSAPAPARYRMLVPLALDVPIRALATVMPYDKAFGRVYAVFHFLALTSLLAMLVYELSWWFTVEQALVGALLVGSTIRIALRQGEYLDLSSIPLTSVFAPHSLLEPIFVAAAVVFALQQRRFWLAALIGVASLNSEAAALLPLVYLAVTGISRSSLMITIGYAGIWLISSLAIRFAIGPSDSLWTIDRIWRENAAHLPMTLINGALFLGPLWWLVASGAKRAPGSVHRVAWLIPVYGLAVAVWGFWWDVRLLMGLYPLVTPLILSALFDPRSSAPTTENLHPATGARIGSVT